MLNNYIERIRTRPSWRWYGRVAESRGLTVESDGPPCSLGECCEIISENGIHSGEVIGFRGSRVLTMPLESPVGIQYGDRILATGEVPSISVGAAMQGRVFNAVGTAVDDGPSLDMGIRRPLDRQGPRPMERVSIREPLSTGIRTIDTLLTIGRGQRVGIFGGSGVGKSTLIGMMTRNTSADITVVGLVGERGREVGEFLEGSLGAEGRKRSVVVISTSDESPLLRMRAALAATSVAEYYASQGKHVLLILDSLTRYAMAAREVGLASGEPPTTKGYTPSVFTRLARLLERAGNFRTGSITAFYTVLMEGDDQQDPLVDTVRSILDGHIVLSRTMAGGGIYPPIEVLDSISRLMPAITQIEHRKRAMTVRKMLSAYARSEDLIRIGAYKIGIDNELDASIKARSILIKFMQQDANDKVSMAEAIIALQQLDIVDV